ncbi:hypothetical protein HN682_05905 [Candidatus Peregrinibacteria bacterium]|jgi:hypothetical protein|nr:hypothetical protein [Candidatus Peregrinibacteria bacterium]
MSEIIINDRDQNKDEALLSFLESSTFVKRAKATTPVTDADFEDIFTKLAGETNPKSFDEFKITVDTTFEGKLNEKLAKWEKKLSIDKTRLQDVFG